MKTEKLHAGAEFSPLNAHDRSGETGDISKPTGDANWQMVVVYRRIVRINGLM